MKRIFEVRKYHPGSPAIYGWQVGSTLVFLKEVNKIDSFVGYGIVENVEKADFMSEEEKLMCQENNWKYTIRFSDLERLNPPKPLKETAIANWNVNGKFLHGRIVSNEELKKILNEV